MSGHRPIDRRSLHTDRLVLRPSDGSDAARAIAIQSDRSVTRNLRMASFPPDPGDIRRWFSDHAREWEAGEAYRFAITRDGLMIGLVDIDGIRWEDGDGSLGYWLAPEAWEAGFATEAARAVTRFGFEILGLDRLRSGHAADNLASGRVLLKLGFSSVDAVEQYSTARGRTIVQHRYSLARPSD